MKTQKLIDELFSIEAKIESEIEKREDVYRERFDKFQESKKAQEFRKRSNLLQKANANIDMAIDNLNEYLGI